MNGEVNQLLFRLLVQEKRTRFDYLANRPVQALDGVGRIDQPAPLGREVEEGNHLRPRAASRLRYSGITAPKHGLLQSLERFFSCYGVGCPVDRFQQGADRLAVPVGEEGRRSADKVHDTRLVFRPRKHCPARWSCPSDHP